MSDCKQLKDGKWVPAEPLPYYYGLFPLIREKIKGTKGIAWYGFEDGLKYALFADWGDEWNL